MSRRTMSRVSYPGFKACGQIAEYEPGFGRLRGRKIVLTADDFSIRAGHADGALMEKTVSFPPELYQIYPDNACRSIWKSSLLLCSCQLSSW